MMKKIAKIQNKKKRPKPWQAPPVNEIYQAELDETAEELIKYVQADFPSRFDFSNPMKVITEGLLQIEGDRSQAIARVVDMISFYILMLNTVAKLSPEKVQQYAATKSLWPVMSGRSPKVVASNQKFFQSISLGTNVSPTKHAIDIGIVNATSKRWAAELLNWIEKIRIADESCGAPMPYPEGTLRDAFRVLLTAMCQSEFVKALRYTFDLVYSCRDLPPFVNDKRVVERWWAVARELLFLNTDGKPESNDELYTMGWYAEKHASSLKKVDVTPFDPLALRDYEPIYSEGSANANIRQAIWKDLRKAFDSIAFNLPKVSKKM